MAKKVIQLTDDNWRDCFRFTVLESLVKGAKLEDGMMDPDSPVVTKLLTWVKSRSDESKDKTYTMTRHDAAAVLQLRGS
jgi:hypothetical protein